MFHRALAIAIASMLGFQSVVARADGALIAELKVPAPEKYAPLAWKYGDKLSSGFWYSSEQVIRTDRRITYLENRAAKECVDAQVVANQSLGGWWKVAGGILVGVGIGFCAGHSSHCGIGK